MSDPWLRNRRFHAVEPLTQLHCHGRQLETKVETLVFAAGSSLYVLSWAIRLAAESCVTWIGISIRNRAGVGIVDFRLVRCRLWNQDMSTRSIIIVEDDAFPALTWMMFWNSFTVESWSVAIVIVATVAPILMFFPDHCFTRCQECQECQECQQGET